MSLETLGDIFSNGIVFVLYFIDQIDYLRYTRRTSKPKRREYVKSVDKANNISINVT
jgi:preprotein translocase subunit Sss1